MKKTAILSFAAALLMAVPAAAIPGDKPKTADNPPETLTDREKWCDALYTMAEPVLSLMSEGRLQEKMLVETSPTWDGRNVRVTYMECFGRLMAGLAPWISLPDDDSQEGKAFLPLGLPADDPFWTSEAEDWTSKKAWEGKDFPRDHSYR